MNQRRIFIKRTEKGWICDMTEAKDSEEIKSTFGTYILPSAYTRAANVEHVLSQISKLNPGHKIIDIESGLSQETF